MVAGAAPMSGREAEVLEMVGAHLTNAEIARTLHISVRTVESHVSSLLRKLGVANRRELAELAVGLAGAADDRGELLSLPSAWTTFVGRERELDAVAAALAAHRLVTLVGPGGIGKTRLAAVSAERAAAAFAGGGAFVDLVPVSAEFVVHAVASALGVVERPREPLDRVVHERLGVGPVLLVLDNCEHVLEAVATFVQDALARSRGLVVLATSRARLGVTGERVLPVPPLELESEAVPLFVDRAETAGAAGGDAAVVADICARLDGIPLAIELAAARSASLGVDGLVAGLGDRLRLLSSGGGPAGRHRSLRAVIDWSHALLDDDERSLFRRLSIFAGAFDLDAVAAVAGDGDTVRASDGVARLTEQSLLVHRGGTPTSRWRMLETIHDYAREQLDAGADGPGTRRRYLAWASAEAGRLERSLDDDGVWQAAFDPVADDLRAALAVAPADVSPDDGVGDDRFALARALGHLGYARRFLVEARDHYATAVRIAPDPASAARALREAADVALAELRGEAAFGSLLAAAERAQEHGDRAGAAIALADAATIAARASATFDRRLTVEEVLHLIDRARDVAPPGDVDVAAHVTMVAAWIGGRGPGDADAELANQALALARQLDDPVLMSIGLDAVAASQTVAGHHRAAAALTAERVALLDRLPRHDPRAGAEVTDIYHTATETALAAGDVDLALRNARLAYDDTINRHGLAHIAAAHLVMPLLFKGAFDDALVHGEVMRRGWDRTGRPPAGWMTPSFSAVALIHGLRGDAAAHDEWTVLATTVARHTMLDAFPRFAAARLALHRGDLEAAVVAAGDVRGLRPSRYAAYLRALAAEVAVAAGRPDADERLAEASAAGAENDFAAACVARAAGRAGDRNSLDVAVARWESLGARYERASTLLLIPSRADEGRRELAALGCGVAGTRTQR